MMGRLASSDFMPPYWLRQRWRVCSLTPRCWSTCAIERPDESMASASRSLLMSCSGVCRVRFIESLEASLGPAGAGRDSHSGWISFRGPGQGGGRSIHDRLLAAAVGGPVSSHQARGRGDRSKARRTTQCSGLAIESGDMVRARSRAADCWRSAVGFIESRAT